MNNSIKRNLSYIILEGPNSLLSTNFSTSYDCILRVIKYPYRVSKVNQAFGIFVDNTNNKHSNFLNPILRSSIYVKHGDLPTVKFYKIPKKYLSTLNNIISNIDINLFNIEFIKAGLILDRIPPDECNYIWKDFHNNFSMELYRWNYCQRINYSWAVNQGKPDIFAKALIGFTNFCDDNKSNFLKTVVEERFSADKDSYIKKYYIQQKK